MTNASEDNVQPHSEVEFFSIFKRPVPKEVTESQVTHATPTPQILLDLYQTPGTELGTAGGLWLRSGARRGLPTGWRGRLVLVLLSDILIQQRSQLGRLVLKQVAGLGHKTSESSNQLPLQQVQARQLGIVYESLPAEDGIIDAATWKTTGAVGLPESALLERHHPNPRTCSPVPPPFQLALKSGSHLCLTPFPLLGTNPLLLP